MNPYWSSSAQRVTDSSVATAAAENSALAYSQRSMLCRGALLSACSAIFSFMNVPYDMESAVAGVYFSGISIASSSASMNSADACTSLRVPWLCMPATVPTAVQLHAERRPRPGSVGDCTGGEHSQSGAGGKVVWRGSKAGVHTCLSSARGTALPVL